MSRPSSLARVLPLLPFALVAACGSGPTEAPKAPDPGIVVGGVPGSTTA